MVQKRRTRQQWRTLIDAWWDSGLTQGEYCRRHSISVSSFARWREVFRREGQPTKPTPKREQEPACTLVPVHWISEPTPHSGGPLSLHFPDGLRLDISVGFDATTVHRLITLLKGRDA